MSEAGKWCYSLNGENFEGVFDTKENAIKEALYALKDEAENDFDYGQDYIDVGQIKPVKLGVHVNWMLEQLGEQAFEQAGDVADDYLYDVKREHEKILEERLNTVLHTWMEEFNYKPNFWTVENIEKVEVPERK